MHLHRVFDHAAVTAGHRQRHGDAPLARRSEHTPIAFGEARGRELEPPEAITFVRVGTGEVEDQTRQRVCVVAPECGERVV